jgi:hypothetical protein
MASEVFQQALQANVVATFMRGRVFNLLSASSPVTITLEQRGFQGGQTTPRVFKGVPAGTKFVLQPGEDDWTYLRLTSPVAQAISLFVGDDDVSFNNAVTVTGTALVSVNPSIVVADTPKVVTVTAQHALFPANVGRKRMTVYSDPANTATVYFRIGGGANDIGFISPGTFEELDTQVAYDYRDPSAGGQNLYLTEES